MKNIVSFVVLAVLLSSCMDAEEMTYQKFLVNGEALYYEKCSNCHGEKGEGLQNLYPPLKNADYFKNEDKVICIIKNGASGEMVVNGKTYNQAMPANPKLYNLDIAEIVTYMYAEFQGERRYITADSVQAKLLRCQD